MMTQKEKAERFLALHRPGDPLLLPNPWDQGSAKLLASMGFQALGTTSSGYAATLGRLEGPGNRPGRAGRSVGAGWPGKRGRGNPGGRSGLVGRGNTVTRDEALAHVAAIVAATDLPVSADLENCFADIAEGVPETVAIAAETGLAGCSIEDFTGEADDPVYDIDVAAERVAAAAGAAHAGPVRLVLTARAENYLYGRPDLDDTIARLRAYAKAGADVLYAPGLTSLADIRRVVSSVDRPVNVLAFAGAPSVKELAGAGVSRVSVGGAFAFAALSALADAAAELRDHGTYGYLSASAVGRQAAAHAF